MPDQFNDLMGKTLDIGASDGVKTKEEVNPEKPAVVDPGKATEVDKPAEKPAEKPADASAEKPAEEKPAEKPADAPAEKPAEPVTPVETPADKPVA